MMTRSIALKLAAIAIGLGTIMAPSAASPALAGISIPLPPPSIAPPTRPKGHVQPSIDVIFTSER
jgi:hypothetical protein